MRPLAQREAGWQRKFVRSMMHIWQEAWMLVNKWRLIIQGWNLIQDHQ